MSSTIDRLTVAFVHGRKEKGRGKAEGRIELRLTLSRQQKYISTGIRCKLDEWDGERVRQRPDAPELNNLLADLMRNVREIEQELRLRSMLSLDNIQARLEQRKSSASLDIWTFFDERISVRSYGKGKTTRIRYRHAVDALRAVCPIKWVDQMRAADIVQYDRSLLAAGLQESTRWHNYHRQIRALMSDAVKAGLIRRNPYDEGMIKRPKEDSGKALDRCLTMEELDRIVKADLGSAYLTRARDLFIFQIYTCMGYADLEAFDPTNVQEFDGRLVYSSRRHKTGEKFTFLILSEAEAILRKYDWRLPKISNQKYNVYLKAVAAIAEVSKPISSHWARHTGATILLNAGVPMDIVARVLGHSNSEITRKVYAKLLDETVAREMLRIEKHI